MKAEINNENKVRFFALYLNQKVLCDNLRSGECLDKSWNWSHKDFWLLLKPLFQISDEDAIEVAKIIVKEFRHENFSHIETNCNCGVYFKNGYINIYPDFSFLATLYTGQSVYQGPESILYAEHFLRSKGYALPWFGLSVEEMIETSWIKLREEETNV